MRLGETLSLTVTLPNEQRIKIPEATAIPLRSTSFGSFAPRPVCYAFLRADVHRLNSKEASL
jgi:hypothetical protein